MSELDVTLNRDQRVDLARWLWDVGTSGRCKTLSDVRTCMQLGEDVMTKLASDLEAKRREMALGKMDGSEV